MHKTEDCDHTHTHKSRFYLKKTNTECTKQRNETDWGTKADFDLMEFRALKAEQ